MIVQPVVEPMEHYTALVVTRLLRTNQCPPLIVSLRHHQPPPVVTSFWWLVLVLTIQTRRMCAIHAVPVPGAGVLRGGHNAQCARVSPAHGRCIVTILCLYAARALLGWAGSWELPTVVF